MAIEKKTGARGLRTILEDVMLDIMYDLPDKQNIGECIITKDAIKTKKVVTIEKDSSSEDKKEKEKKSKKSTE